MLMNIFLLSVAVIAIGYAFKTEIVFSPNECSATADLGDHLLVEYQSVFSNGTNGPFLRRPDQLLHIHLLESGTGNLPVTNTLLGMCSNSTRKISWEDGKGINLLPIFVAENSMSGIDTGFTLFLKVVHLTKKADYKIFDALRIGNISEVIDMISDGKGVNAVDEWGQTPLMIAVSSNNIDVFSALLNARSPRVDVNIAKSSGFTALFYAVEKGQTSMVTMLLKKGANPNALILQEGSRGNTPLHFACMLEKEVIAELLLQHGARIDVINQFGKTPSQLLPKDLVPSKRLVFKRLFSNAPINSKLDNQRRSAAEL